MCIRDSSYLIYRKKFVIDEAMHARIVACLLYTSRCV